MSASTKGPKRDAGSSRTGSAKKGSKPRYATVRRVLPVALVVGVSAVVLVGLAALPIRTWVDQRRATEEIRQEVTNAEVDVAELELKLALLETDAEVERMARENFDLVYPGEESYRILPAPESPDRPADGPPSIGD